jgi:type IV pilus assembly protein PilY1
VLTTAIAASAAGAAPPLVELATEPLCAGCAPRPESLRAAAVLAATPSGMAVFQASARPGSWSGQFTRSALSVDDTGAQVSAPQWEAGALLDALPDAAASRRVYTSKLEQGVRVTIPFAWDELSVAQRTALNRAPPPARPVSDRKGEQRLAWLRGDRSQEDRLFRRRSSLLGDAVNSVPVYAGPPAAAGGDGGSSYRAYHGSNQSRRPAVYLGANDGMLHAFDAENGAELFAYVPDALFPALNRLPERSYVHGAYVDGPAAVADAQLAGTWKTVLVSAIGAGAQGVFALDVTNPSAFPLGGGALWEFTDRDDAAMGNVTSLPQIVKVRLRSGADEYRYFALVASGFNNHASDGHADAGNTSALFLLALDKPAGEAWRLNRNYYRLTTPAGEPGRANALGAPALAVDGSGALRFAYAGDLQGNLWRFNFTGGAPWRGPAEGPVFVARDAQRVRQAITGQSRAVIAPDGGYLVLFGTGRLLGAEDRQPSGYAQQSFYAVLDDRQEAGPGAPLGRPDLAERTLEGAAGNATLALRGRSFSYGGSGKQGWYVDFLGTAGGERSTSGATLALGQVFFNTVITGAGPCAPVSSRSYAMDAVTGLAPDSAGLPASGEATATLAADYLPGPPAVVVTAGEVSGAEGTGGAGGAGSSGGAGGGGGAGSAGGPAARQASGRTTVGKRITAVSLGSGAAGPLAAVRTRAVVVAGRIGWREVANWRELHQARAREPRP